jgi:predicted lipoprotein with Yx(FWY)xxD motif
MRRALVILGGTVGMLIVAACGSAAAGTTPTVTGAPPQAATSAPTPVATPTPSQAGPAPATGATVALQSVGSLGQILVGPDGKTLYFFLADTGTSTCNGQCAQNWPPLTTTGTPRATGGVSPSLLGITKRDDGSTQVTYDGHPLYSFIADSAPGVANGEGIDAFGAKWEVVSASGTAVVK